MLDHQEFLEDIKKIYCNYGPSKSMVVKRSNPDIADYFLLRKFSGLNDLLIIFNTRGCPFNCTFCNLKKQKTTDKECDVLIQFKKVCWELRHSLSIVERLTLSNNSSVLNEDIFPSESLLLILRALKEFKSLKEVVMESNMYFIEANRIRNIMNIIQGKRLVILTGFETLNEEVRTKILRKPESVELFIQKLDILKECDCDFTAYILYKPDFRMTDNEAYEEAEKTVTFLHNEAMRRGIKLSLRINPMYAAEGTLWCEEAKRTPEYLPPNLSDIIRLARSCKEKGISVYIGLSTENSTKLFGCYRYRQEYSKAILKEAIKINVEG